MNSFRNRTELALKTAITQKLWIFYNFGVNFRFVYLKTALISPNKTTGQRIQALSNVFSILMYEVFRNFDKSCKEQQKLGIFGLFVIFGVILG